MQKGCVWLDQQHGKGQPTIQRIRRAKKVLTAGDILHFYYDENVLNSKPPEATLISDQGAYSIWNKPSGMLSQGSKWGDHCTINRWAEKHLLPQRPAFIVHRLDRAASGLIILAHKKQVAAQFSAMFQAHDIEKHYRVSVSGDFSVALPDNKKVKTVTAMLDEKKAVSHASFIQYNANKNESLLDVAIETGRKHQIRRHLSGLGFPVVGDRLYGSIIDSDNYLHLSAVLLTFTCPVSDDKKQFLL